MDFLWVSFLTALILGGVALVVRAVLRELPPAAATDGEPASTADGQPLDGSKAWKWWLTAGVLLLLIGSTTYKELDRLLVGMHVQGSPSSGLSGVEATSDPANHAAGVVFEWRLFADETKLSSPTGARSAYSEAPRVVGDELIVDSLLIVPSYLLILLIFWLLLRTVEARWRRSGADPPRVANLAGAPIFWAFFIGAASFDLIENALSWWIVRIDWGATASAAAQEANGFSSGGEGQLASGVLVAAARAATLAKWAFLGVSALALLLLLLEAIRLRRDSFHKAWQAVGSMRVAVVLVIVLAVLFRISDQAFDVIRRWSPYQAILVALLGVAFAYLIWEVGRRLIHSRFTRAPDWNWPVKGLFILGLLLLVFFVRVPEGLRAFADRGLALVGAVLVLISLASWASADGSIPWGAVAGSCWSVVQDPIAALRGIGRRFRAVGHRARNREARQHDWRHAEFLVVPQILATAVLVVLGLATLQASVGARIYAPTIEGGHMVALAMWGLFLVFLPWPLFHVLRKRTETAKAKGPVDTNGLWIVGSLLALTALVAVVGGAGWWSLWSVTVWMGTVCLLLAFLILVLCVTALLNWIAERLNPPSVFRLFGTHRVPLLSLLLIWVILAPHVDFADYHDVRSLKRAPGVESASLNDVLARWERRNVPADATGVIPLIFVATSGGGIRAAYWTARVLDCVTEQDPPSTGAQSNPCPGGSYRRRGFALSNRVFAMSGVSGGSLGLAAYAAYLTEKAKQAGQVVDPDWFDSRLGGDYLAPTMAWNLLVQTPRSFLRFSTGMDSAEVLERAWERSWGSVGDLRNGLLWTWAHQPEVPLLMLEGTTVADGCRFTSSVLHAGLASADGDCHALQDAGVANAIMRQQEQFLASTHDLVSFLCLGDDVRLSTGALLSARFPFVSPSGRLSSCGGGTTTHIVDGGYYDTSGAGALLETWSALQPLVDDYNRTHGACIAPYFIQIDNGYQQVQAARGEKRPNELTVSNTTSQATRGAHSSAEEAAAKLLFDRPFVSGGRVLTSGTGEFTSRYAAFLTQAHPGVQAPLGWTLSSVARKDLRDQIALRDNSDAVNLVRSWLSSKMSCPRLVGTAYRSEVFDRPVAATFATPGWSVVDLPHQLSFSTSAGTQAESVTILDSSQDPSSLVQQVFQTIDNQTTRMNAESPPHTTDFAGLGTIPEIFFVNREPPLRPCHVRLLPPVIRPLYRTDAENRCGTPAPPGTLGLDVGLFQAVMVASVKVQQGVALITITGTGLQDVEPLEQGIAGLLKSCCLSVSGTG